MPRSLWRAPARPRRDGPRTSWILVALPAGAPGHLDRLAALINNGGTNHLQGGKGPESLMTDVQTITLARHGRVDVAWNSRIPGGEFANFVALFNAAGLVPTSRPAPDTCQRARDAHTLVCSDLRRAVDSMELVAPGQRVLQEPLLREAEIPTLFRTPIRLRAGTWAALARASWHIRRWPGIESPREARERSKRAADVLEALAEQEGSVFVLGHGYFNASVARQLRRRGWRGPSVPATRNWSCVTYQRPC